MVDGPWGVLWMSPARGARAGDGVLCWRRVVRCIVPVRGVISCRLTAGGVRRALRVPGLRDVSPQGRSQGPPTTRRPAAPPRPAARRRRAPAAAAPVPAGVPGPGAGRVAREPGASPSQTLSPATKAYLQLT